MPSAPGPLHVETVGLPDDHDDSVVACAIAPFSDWKDFVCASGSYNGDIKLWSAKDVKPKSLEEHEDTVRCLQFSQDGKMLCSGGKDGSIVLWNVEKGSKVSVFEGHDNFVTALVFSPDAKHIVSGSGDTRVLVWDIGGKKEPRECDHGHNSFIRGVLYSKCGKFVFSYSMNPDIIGEELETGETFHMSGHTAPVSSVNLSGDGTKMLTSSYDNSCKIWDMESRSCICTLSGHDEKVTSFQFIGDESLAISTSLDETAIIWEVEKQKKKHKLKGHKGPVYGALPFADGSLVTWSNDSTLKLWSVETGEEIDSLEGHQDTICCVAVSADNSTLLTGSDDESTRIWSTNEELVDVFIPKEVKEAAMAAAKAAEENQTKKALQMDNVSPKADKDETDKLRNAVRERDNDLSKVRKENADLEKRLDSVQRQLDEKDKSLTATRKALSEKESELEAQRQQHKLQLDELSTQISKLEHELESSKNQAEDNGYDLQNEESDSALGARQYFNGDLASELEKARDAESTLRTALETEKRKSTNLQEELNQKIRELEDHFEDSVGDISMNSVVMVPDRDRDNCSMCQTQFTTLNRRHHCRSCGEIFCAVCSAHRLPLPHLGHTKDVRVCTACFIETRSNFSRSVGF